MHVLHLSIHDSFTPIFFDLLFFCLCFGLAQAEESCAQSMTNPPFKRNAHFVLTNHFNGIVYKLIDSESIRVSFVLFSVSFIFRPYNKRQALSTLSL